MSHDPHHPSARRRRPARLALLLALGLAAAAFWPAQRPLTAPLTDRIEIAGMTWVEVRAALARGATTVIVPTGGIEQNGPHMATAKHDRIVRWTANRIAAELGRTLVAPVVSFVPEGDYDPPTGNMQLPGTIGVPEPVFAGLIEGIARSLKRAGFRTICLIADHGQSLKRLSEVAERLDRAWAAEGVRVIHVDAYYADAPQRDWLLAQGESDATIGHHAGIADTSELLAVWPEGVFLDRIAAAQSATEFTGASGAPERASAERSRALLALKVAAAVRQIRAALPADRH